MGMVSFTIVQYTKNKHLRPVGRGCLLRDCFTQYCARLLIALFYLVIGYSGFVSDPNGDAVLRGRFASCSARDDGSVLDGNPVFVFPILCIVSDAL